MSVTTMSAQRSAATCFEQFVPFSELATSVITSLSLIMIDWLARPTHNFGGLLCVVEMVVTAMTGSAVCWVLGADVS
jgi:hypothetical protein